MGRTLATLGALILGGALAVAGASPVSAARHARTPDAEGQADLDALQRLLVAVLATDALTDLPLAALATRLHVADPAATPVVMVPGAPRRTIGSFAIEIAAPTADDSVVRVRIAVDGQPALVTPARPSTRDPAPPQATIVEILGGPTGIVAHREGLLDLTPDELRVPRWRLPDRGEDAVALDGAWWSLGPTRLVVEGPAPAATDRVRGRLARDPVSRMRRLVDVSVGDVTGDGVPDIALSFRRPYRETLLNRWTPRRSWTDAAGLSAHVGLYRVADLSEVWVAGTLVRPVRRLAACTGALAVAYSTLRRDRITATSAWRWQGFAFLPLPELPGRGTPMCVDVDRDGRSEPAIVERS